MMVCIERQTPPETNRPDQLYRERESTNSYLKDELIEEHSINSLYSSSILYDNSQRVSACVSYKHDPTTRTARRTAQKKSGKWQ